MNERIKQLAEQAGWMMGDEIEGFNTRLEKFAELIIKRCIIMCETVAEQAELTNSGETARKTKATAEGCAKLIKLSFGVE